MPGPTDGRLEVALAIERVTALVTVDPTKTPFSTQPDDLFDHNFSDPEVGISDEQMAVFKETLALLLPAIAADVSNVPENSAQPIEKVANFVRLALLKAST